MKEIYKYYYIKQIQKEIKLEIFIVSFSHTFWENSQLLLCGNSNLIALNSPQLSQSSVCISQTGFFIGCLVTYDLGQKDNLG